MLTPVRFGRSYDPIVDGRRYTFGVSGLLYQRDLLFYDLRSGSLWSQLFYEAVTGPLAGKSLKVLPAKNTTWGAWKMFHPRTRVLSFETGIQGDHRQDPYAAYPLSRAPAVFLVGTNGLIKFEYVDPDYKVRIHPDLLVAAARVNSK